MFINFTVLVFNGMLDSREINGACMPGQIVRSCRVCMWSKQTVTTETPMCIKSVQFTITGGSCYPTYPHTKPQSPSYQTVQTLLRQNRINLPQNFCVEK